VGVFALKNIPKNTDPFAGIRKTRWRGMSKKDLAGLDSKIRKLVYDFFSVQGGKIWVPENGLNGMDMSFYLNTSGKPNIKTVGDGSDFLTIRPVKAGEELTVDYKSFSEQENII
jgi:hypothetical protein